MVFVYVFRVYDFKLEVFFCWVYGDVENFVEVGIEVVFECDSMGFFNVWYDDVYVWVRFVKSFDIMKVFGMFEVKV